MKALRLTLLTLALVMVAGYQAPEAAQAEVKGSPNVMVSTLAGGNHFADGVGNAARFNWPRGIAMSADGSFVLIADTNNHVIRRLNVATKEVVTIAGSPGQPGYADGVGSAARFYNPSSIALSSNDSFALVFSSGLRRINLANGAVTTFTGVFGGDIEISPDSSFALIAAGSSISKLNLSTGATTLVAGDSAGNIGSADGIGQAARFNGASGIAISPDGSFALVTDTYNYTIRRIDLATAEVTTPAGTPGTYRGNVDGVGSAASFSSSIGPIEFSHTGTFALLFDGGSIRKIDISSRTVTTLFSSVSYSGDLALSPNDSYALFTYYEDHRIRQIDLSTGVVNIIAGQDPNIDGSFETATFEGPYSIALSHDNSFALVVDEFGTTVRRLDLRARTVTTIAGLEGQPGSTDGVGSAARFNFAFGGGIALSSDDSFALIVDNNGIRRMDLATNNVTTIPSSLPFFSEDIAITTNGSTAIVLSNSSASSIYRADLITGQTTLLASNFGSSLGFDLSPDGSFAIISVWDSDSIIRLEIATGVMTTIAGGGGTYIGAVDGVGTAAGFSQPRGVAISADGSYALITDAFQAGAIRRIDLTTNAVTTIAGSTSSNGVVDGSGDTAGFDWPEDIVLSADGAFALVTESRDGRSIRILRFVGAVETLVGGTPGAADGQGSGAQFSNPGGVAYLPDGSAALIADGDNHTIRRLNLANNQVTTIAGSPGQPGNADGVGAAVRFDTPSAIAVSADASFALIADDGNASIRRLDLTTNAVVTVATNVAPCTLAGPAVRRIGIASIDIEPGDRTAIFTNACASTLNRVILAGGTISTIAGVPNQSGNADGPGTQARFNTPLGVAISPNGTQAAVADSGNAAVRLVDLASGQVSTLASLSTTQASLQQTTRLSGIAYASGYIAVSDEVAQTISGVLLSNGDVETIAGAAGQVGFRDGVGAQARFNGPTGLASRPGTSELLIADTNNHAIRAINFLPRLASIEQVYLPIILRK